VAQEHLPCKCKVLSSRNEKEPSAATYSNVDEVCQQWWSEVVCARLQWLTPDILGNWEAEIRRISI
jgi:hypothetical protein